MLGSSVVSVACRLTSSPAKTSCEVVPCPKRQDSHRWMLCEVGLVCNPQESSDKPHDYRRLCYNPTCSPHCNHSIPPGMENTFAEAIPSCYMFAKAVHHFLILSQICLPRICTSVSQTCPSSGLRGDSTHFKNIDLDPKADLWLQVRSVVFRG